MPAPSLKPIRLRISKKILKLFRDAAVAAYRDHNKEILCFLIGEQTNHAEYRLVEVKELFFPEDVLAHATKDGVELQDEWFEEAENYAREINLTTVGDLHSHPDCIQAHQSELDVDYARTWNKVSGICAVYKTKKRYMSRFRFWGPTTPVDVL